MSFPYTLPFAFGVDVSTPTSSPFATGKVVPRDLAIDPETGDLLLSGGDLTLVRDATAIAQEVTIRLNFLLGEWFLDTEAGMPYFQSILVKSPNLAAIRSIFHDEILNVAGINSVIDLTLDYNRQARRLDVSWRAASDLGELTGETDF